MKKKILTIISVLIIVALLAALGTLAYVIYDQIVNFGSPDRRDDKQTTTEVTTEVADPADNTTAPEETVEFTFPVFYETAIETTAPFVEEQIPEKILEDGTKEVYSYDENGNLIERVRYDADGNLLTTYKIIYEDGKVAFEKLYNAAGKLEAENAYTDETVSTTTYFYDESGNVTSGVKYVVHLTEDETYEEHTLNQYGGVIYSKYSDKNGELILTREHHFTPSGYRDGYTETDKDGNSARYNDDGTVRVEETTAATTAATTKPKPKPASTTAATTAKTTAKTTATTEKPKPAEPSVVTETSVNGSDKVVRYYNVAKDGTKTLSNTITYRTIAGKELVLTNIDEIRGYGRQNEYDASGNLLRYLTYNVKYGKRTLEIWYDANGNVTKRTTYEYNSDGKKIKESTFDATDNLTGYVTYEYIKTNSGSKTKIVTYNAKGQQVSTVVR